MFNESCGVTPTENKLAELCDKTFLSLWSYPNPCKEDNNGKELCDLLAVFGNRVFIFFDRERKISFKDSKRSTTTIWNSWKREVIDKQIKCAKGADRYIRNGGRIFLDAKKTKSFPITINTNDLLVYKIVVARGSRDACKDFYPEKTRGSLAVTYSFGGENNDTDPFHLILNKEKPVHIFDDFNLELVLSELDTVSDFAAYLDEKESAIDNFKELHYCGEEDLLANYLMQYDKPSKRHFIAPKPNNKNEYAGIIIKEDQWCQLIKSDRYKETKKENDISYHWDAFIQRVYQDFLEGKLQQYASFFENQEEPIHYMIKEPRFSRRGLSNRILECINDFPDSNASLLKVDLIPSFYEDTAYIFLQWSFYGEDSRSLTDKLNQQREMLRIACGVAKTKWEKYSKFIGIGIESPKFSSTTGAVDLIFYDFKDWDDRKREFYKKRNESFGFFEKPGLYTNPYVNPRFVSKK